MTHVHSYVGLSRHLSVSSEFSEQITFFSSIIINTDKKRIEQYLDNLYNEEFERVKTWLDRKILANERTVGVTTMLTIK